MDEKESFSVLQVVSCLVKEGYTFIEVGKMIKKVISQDNF